jgi:hypothetical protein
MFQLMQEPTHLSFQDVDYNHHVGAIPSFTPYLPLTPWISLVRLGRVGPGVRFGAVLKRCALVCVLHADIIHVLETDVNQGIGEDFN